MYVIAFVAGVVAFIVAILVSIGLHEIGHMVPAKRFGAKVSQYFIGFGPTVWSRQIGETEYGVKAIPLGGFVKIVGMLPPGRGEQVIEEHDAEGHRVVKVRSSSTGFFSQLISDARAAELQLVEPADEPRLFYKLTWWKKAITMVSGPLTNVLIAFLIFWGLFATVGRVVGVSSEPVVAEVLPCVVPASENGRACTDDELKNHPTPASLAGLKAGDRFVSFNGEQISDWAQLQKLIRGNGDQTATLGIERDGQTLSVQVKTLVEPRPVDPDHPGDLTKVGFLGVAPVSHDIVERGGPIYTARQMGTATVDVVKALGSLPVKVWHVGLALFGVEQRSPDSPVSIVGGGRLAGQAVASDQLSARESAIWVTGLVASFNLFIGLFNLIPLLPMDGGHIAGALYEGARRRLARLRRRADPGYVDVARLLPIAYVVGAALLLMGSVLIVADLVIPVQQPF